MKKLLGVSFVTILAVMPVIASAADPTTPIVPVATNDTTVGVASTKYVKEAYNAMAGKVNAELETINTALNGKQATMSAGKGIDITGNKVSVDAGTGLDFDGTGDNAKLQLSADTQSALTAAGTALQKADITAGSANGTISVKGTDVSVKGLGTAAYTASSAYATSTQGGKADSAIQSVKVNGTALTADSNKAVNVTVATGTGNGTIAVNGTDVSVKGLGTAAYTASSAYATSGQGTKADSAIQSVKINGTALTADSNKAVNVTVATGTGDGTIAVNGTDVSVKGLGSAAYTDSGAYATSAQGTKADNAATAIGTGTLSTTADTLIAAVNEVNGKKLTVYSGWNNGGDPTVDTTKISLN